MSQNANHGQTQRVRRRSGPSGFTFIEVVVSLTLLGFGAMAVFAGLSACAGAAHHARLLTRSVLIAERLLVDAQLSRSPTFETRKGQEGAYLWQVRLASTPIEGLGAIHVQVTWSEQHRPQQYDLCSLIAMQSFAERWK